MALQMLFESLRLGFLEMSPWQTLFCAWIFTYGYYLAMGLPITIYWRVFPWRMSSKTHPWRDFKAGTIACVILTLFLAFTFWLIQNGFSEVRQLYASKSWLWQIRQCFIYIVLHDFYFYAMHRVLHHPIMFRRYHRLHHQSYEPNPWSTFAFHPVEAVLTSVFLPLFVVTIPISPLCFIVFMSLTALFNTIGHNGYEFFPKIWRRSLLGQILNNYSNHARHHRFVTECFGLYTSIWDRLFGTFGGAVRQTIADHTKLWNNNLSNRMREQSNGSTSSAATSSVTSQSKPDHDKSRTGKHSRQGSA